MPRSPMMCAGGGGRGVVVVRVAAAVATHEVHRRWGRGGARMAQLVAEQLFLWGG
eukprot:COSAG02_NODE_4385_length_5421_cov_4.928035_1_plen_55_part_00